MPTDDKHITRTHLCGCQEPRKRGDHTALDGALQVASTISLVLTEALRFSQTGSFTWDVGAGDHTLSESYECDARLCIFSITSPCQLSRH